MTYIAYHIKCSQNLWGQYYYFPNFTLEDTNQDSEGLSNLLKITQLIRITIRFRQFKWKAHTFFYLTCHSASYIKLSWVLGTEPGLSLPSLKQNPHQIKEKLYFIDIHKIIGRRRDCERPEFFSISSLPPSAPATMCLQEDWRWLNNWPHVTHPELSVLTLRP